MTPRLSRAIAALVSINAAEDKAVADRIKAIRKEFAPCRAQCNQEYGDAFAEAAGRNA